MKVCYIISTTNNCGPVNMLYNLLFNFRKIEDFYPTIITLKPDDLSKSRCSQFEKLGIEIKHFYNKRTQFKDILKYIEKNNFKVIHSHGLIPDLINSYILKHEKNNIFHITTQHNYPFEDYLQSKGRILGYLMAITQILTIKNLYRVSCSYSIAKKFNQIKIKTKTIQNGIIFPKEIEKKTKNNPPIFLYLGRIIKRKNVSFLINYFQYHPEYEFWIVGDGNDYEAIKENTLNIKNIKVLGKTEAPSKFYKKVDYYISASKSEGLPLSVLEALSYGIPCVLSKIPSHNELLDKNSGVLFINNDIDSLNFSIKALRNNEYDSYKIYFEMKEKFDAEVMMDNYIEIYRRNI